MEQLDRLEPHVVSENRYVGQRRENRNAIYKALNFTMERGIDIGTADVAIDRSKLVLECYFAQLRASDDCGLSLGHVALQDTEFIHEVVGPIAVKKLKESCATQKSDLTCTFLEAPLDRLHCALRQRIWSDDVNPFHGDAPSVVRHIRGI